MKRVALALCLTFAAVACVLPFSGVKTVAPAAKGTGCHPCPCGPDCDCEPCDCPGEGPRAEWWPGRALVRVVVRPFRPHHRPHRPR